MPFWKWTCPHCDGAYYEHEKKHNLGRIASNHERRCGDRPKDKDPATSVNIETRATTYELARGATVADFVDTPRTAVLA